MNFYIPAGSSTELPKEAVDSIVEQALDKSFVLKMIDNRGNFIKVLNEGSIPVYGNMDLDKVYRLDNTADITTLTENSFSVQAPTLNPIEAGTYTRLSRKEELQYPEAELDKLFERKLSEAMGLRSEQMALVGDTTAVGATNPLSICNGIVTIAKDATLCANTPVTYTASNSQGILNVVNDAQASLGNYGDELQMGDLIIFANSSFVSAIKNTANLNYIGYDIADVPELGLRAVPHVHGIPVVRSAFVTTADEAVLVNMKGMFGGYRQLMTADAQWEAARRATLIVLTYHIDFTWGFLNDSAKAEGLVSIQKTS